MFLVNPHKFGGVVHIQETLIQLSGIRELAPLLRATSNADRLRL